jgi:hypothetical protein
MNTCETCCFYERNLQQCRRVPPKVILAEEGYGDTRWPEPAWNDWCGEHRTEEEFAIERLRTLGIKGHTDVE